MDMDKPEWTEALHKRAEELSRRAGKGEESAFWDLIDLYALHGFPFKRAPLLVQEALEDVKGAVA